MNWIGVFFWYPTIVATIVRNFVDFGLIVLQQDLAPLMATVEIDEISEKEFWKFRIVASYGRYLVSNL